MILPHLKTHNEVEDPYLVSDYAMLAESSYLRTRPDRIKFVNEHTNKKYKMFDDDLTNKNHSLFEDENGNLILSIAGTNISGVKGRKNVIEDLSVDALLALFGRDYSSLTK
jgi:hypothetical protein